MVGQPFLMCDGVVSQSQCSYMRVRIETLYVGMAQTRNIVAVKAERLKRWTIWILESFISLQTE